MNNAAALVAAIGTAVGAVLGAWSLVVKERGDAARPVQLLKRLWDWVQSSGLEGDVPESLTNEIRREIEGDDPQ